MTENPWPPPWQRDDPAGVRIADVRTVVTAPAGVPLVVVKVLTSDDGLYGLGCATFAQRPLAVVSAIQDYLRPQLIGRDPADVTDSWHALQLSSYWRAGPVLNNALSGVDLALWDIKGKQAGLPVWQLLGGRARLAVPAYVHARGRDAHEVTDAVLAHLEAGFGHVRCQVAVPGVRTYGYPEVVAADGADGVRRGLAADGWDAEAYLRTIPRLFEHLRGALGEEVRLLHDAHERLTPSQAIRLAKDLEPYHLFFLEDPVAPEDLGWLPTLRAQTSTPIAIGELFVGPGEYLPVVSQRWCDYIRCHLSAIGGITPALRLAATAELFGIRTAWHGPGDVSPVGHAANLALDIALPNTGIQELYAFPDAVREVFPGTPVAADGHLWPSAAPGLGVDIDERLAAAFPPLPPLTRDGWTATRRTDGAVQRP
ncbi:enolase C-terminal domain-like protein [Jiangella asiatica]|uniref:Starvation-sensing protein RspA n=1 Tax=Jiangella asiatica TaxID=2530372 RepID=A0A4R5DBW9_9ACTN|nr:enolase C-terminal domain-like protein [Jiangella asiatica]TDE11202.1 starvation-sensing protein RspA [Jiangella asiatica]